MRDELKPISVPAHRRRAIEIPSARVRDSVGVLFDLNPLKTQNAKGTYRMSDWHTDRGIFSITDSDSFTIRRTQSQSRDGEPLVFVHRYLAGGLRGRSGDVNIDRQPGAIYIIDQASQVECVQDASLMQSLIVPKTAIGYDVDTHPLLIKVPSNQGLGRTIDGLFDIIFSGLLQDNSIQDPSIDSIFACLRLAINEKEPRGDIRRVARNAVAQKIFAYIENNLDQWNLSVNTILRDFGASRASLYRIFEDYGGVRQYIGHRRLLRAVMDISARPIARGQIASAAERWGFSSSASFNRAVRREFGVPPGDLVSLPKREQENLASRIGREPFRKHSAQSVHRLLAEQMRLPA